MSATHWRTKMLRFLSAGVMDQILLSGASFLVSLLLIRHTSTLDFSLYVLSQSTLLLLLTIQGAWLHGPLAVLAPNLPQADKDHLLRAVAMHLASSLTRWGLPIASLGLLAVYAAGYLSAIQAGVVAAAILATWAMLQREYLRNVFVINASTPALIQTDALYALLLVLSAAVACFISTHAVVWILLGSIGAAWASIEYSRKRLNWKATPPALNVAAIPWDDVHRLGLWAVIGAVIYWLFAQSYTYVLAARLDLTAVADVSASRLMLMPAFIITQGLRSLILPSATNWLAQYGIKTLTRRILVFSALFSLIHLGYYLALWLARDFLSASVFKATIHNRDNLLLLWAAIALIGLLRELFQVVLMSLEKFRLLAILTGVSAVTALASSWYCLPIYGASGALIGQIAGELVGLVGIFYCIWRANAYTHPSRLPL